MRQAVIASSLPHSPNSCGLHDHKNAAERRSEITHTARNLLREDQIPHHARICGQYLDLIALHEDELRKLADIDFDLDCRSFEQSSPGSIRRYDDRRA